MYLNQPFRHTISCQWLILYSYNKFNAKSWDHSDSFKGREQLRCVQLARTHIVCRCNEMVSYAHPHFDMQEIYWCYRPNIWSNWSSENITLVLVVFWCSHCRRSSGAVSPGLWFWCWWRGPSIFFLFQTGRPGSLFHRPTSINFFSVDLFTRD